jgi:hypothetical protein
MLEETVRVAILLRHDVGNHRADHKKLALQHVLNHGDR